MSKPILEPLEYSGGAIKLNVDGDMLVPFDEYKETGIELPSTSVVGTHAGCGGDVAFIKNITGNPEYAALHCTLCGMRVVLHNTVTDIQDLYTDRRMYLLTKMPRPAA